jgi:hypothetical protein
MVEDQRMTAPDVVAQSRDGWLKDFARAAVVLVAAELMERRRGFGVGAELGETTAETRVASVARLKFVDG